MKRKASRVSSNEAYLRLLHDTNSKQRKQLIKIGNSDQINSVCECAFNILRKNITLNPTQLSKLRRYRKFVYRVADKKIPISQKRKALEQSGGFLPALLAPILGVALGGIVEKIIGK